MASIQTKRSIVPQDRLIELAQPNSYYEIGCRTDDCCCEFITPNCTRGFFSLFIQVTYGIAFARKHNLPWYVNFGNVEYCYSCIDDPAHSFNFWNNYFTPNIDDIDNTNLSKIKNRLYIEGFPLRVWSRSYLKWLHEEGYKPLVYNETTTNYLDGHLKTFAGQKVLGVQIRRTDHSQEVLPVSIENFLKEIDRQIPKFDKLFVATDDKATITMLEKRFPDKLINLPAIRSSNGDPLHIKSAPIDRYTLGLEVLRDCYLLSKCNSAILMHSNISYSALIMNPTLPYTLMERWPVRLRKWKTLIAYYLNKWGIRKW